MVSQSELSRRFAAGSAIESLPQASNVKASTVNGLDALLGYGHAVYAVRYAGAIYHFEGWRGYSVATSCQLTELKKGYRAAGAEVEMVDARPRDRHGERPEAEDLPGAPAEA